MTVAFSSAVRLIGDPAGTYRRLGAEPAPTGIPLLLRRPLLVCLVFGVAVGVAGTGRVTAGLVLSSAACWSFVPAVQLAAFAVLMRFARPAIPFSRAADLFFLGHGPWSLWLLAVAAAGALTFPEGVTGWPRLVLLAVALSALLPLALTCSITSAFCREVLALPRRRAAAATALYEGLVWGFALVYVFVTTQLWPRMLAL